MPVPTLITDLSTTLASNSPAGSDNVFPSLDDYLRALSGFIASIRDNSGNGWVSPYLPLTYAAGTANGVVYLNGSKVVTTGSGLVFDGSNLGLGVTPSAWLDGGYIDFPGNGYVGNANGYSSNTLSTGLNAYYATGAWRYKASSLAATRFDHTNGTFAWYTAPSGTAGTDISFTQAMTLDASGRLMVGTTAPNVSTARYNCFNAPTGTNVAGSFKNDGGSSAQTIEAWNAATTGNNVFISLATEGTFTERGSISYNRAGGLVAYNTTSDYRAKDIIGPVQNPGATIDALKVYEGRMKGATQSRPMLVAHEAQAVASYCVTGEKDAVSEDGAPIFQQMDVSSLVPLLLVEIQSLRARVAALEAA